MNQPALPHIEEFLVQAVRTIRRKNTPSTVRPSQLWTVVKSIGYLAEDYEKGLRQLVTNDVIFCYGNAQNPREQRIMPAKVDGYNFQRDEYGDYRHVRLAIFADGLTSEGKRALAHACDIKDRLKAEKIIATLQEL